MVASTLAHCWRLKREARAGHSHGKSDRNTEPEFHSCHCSPAETEPPVLGAAVPGRAHQEQQRQAGNTRSLPPGKWPGEGSASCTVGTPITIPWPPHPTQFTFGFWTLPAEPKVSLESRPNWHSSYSPLHSSYVISSVAQRRTGSSGFLYVGTMLHRSALYTTTLKLCLRHTSVSASRGRLQLEFKALHSERATPASQL